MQKTDFNLAKPLLLAQFLSSCSGCSDHNFTASAAFQSAHHYHFHMQDTFQQKL